MDLGSTRVKAGTVEFALQYRHHDGGSIGTMTADQGVCIQVVGDVGGKETELLRFDCFHQLPHYHYGPENQNQTLMIDRTMIGNPLGWAIGQLRERLPEMLDRAGYRELADRLDTGLVKKKLDEVESIAREMSIKQRYTAKAHFRQGTEIIDAGAIRFGLEYLRVNPNPPKDGLGDSP